jgi:hypothetical protein
VVGAVAAGERPGGAEQVGDGAAAGRQDGGGQQGGEAVIGRLGEEGANSTSSGNAERCRMAMVPSLVGGHGVFNSPCYRPGQHPESA